MSTTSLPPPPPFDLVMSSSLVLSFAAPDEAPDVVEQVSCLTGSRLPLGACHAPSRACFPGHATRNTVEQVLELVEVHGLDEPVVEACLERAGAVLRAPVTRDGHEAHVSRRRARAHANGDVVAVDAGQPD